MSKPSQVIRKGERVQAVLDEFSARTPEALIAMVTTSDGLSVASTRKEAIAKEEDALAVAGAGILEMAADVNHQLNQGRIGRILIEGIRGTAMPSFKLLPEDEIEALIEYVKYLTMRGEMERELARLINEDLPLDEATEMPVRLDPANNA